MVSATVLREQWMTGRASLPVSWVQAIKLKRVQPRVGVAQHRVALPIKTVDPFYVRPEWRAFALEVKKQRDYTCEDCGKRDWSVHADHIIELRDGGEPFDPLNVRIRCHACHNRKTAKAKGARLSGG